MISGCEPDSARLDQDTHYLAPRLRMVLGLPLAHLRRNKRARHRGTKIAPRTKKIMRMNRHPNIPSSFCGMTPAWAHASVTKDKSR